MDFLRACILLFGGLCMIASSFAASIQYPGGARLLRNKRDHGQGITGPVHTYVKTDKHANFKWGVRHHVGKHYAGN